MIDLFVILTPFLLLAVICLLGFVGCAAIAGIGNIQYQGAGPTITKTNLPAGMFGYPYKAPLTATGGTPPYDWSSTNLPLWLGFNNVNSQEFLVGVPPGTDELGTTIHITVTDKANLTDARD